jgi:peptidoglycan/LPS O-acetylase OafA/YrhL
MSSGDADFMTLDAAKPKHRYVALDSLRGVCACMVVLLHFMTQGHIASLSIVKHGFLFVDFFFVLSGFVIGSSYGDRLAQGFSIGRFMWLRLGRIYPLHVVMLVAFLAFELFFAYFMPNAAARAPFKDSFSLASLVQSLFLVQIFFGPDATPWNGPSWSIAAELWTYLLFALLLRYGRRALVPVSLAVAVAAPLILASLTDRNMNVFHDGALIRCLFGFSLGMIGWRCTAFVQSVALPRWADYLLEIAIVLATGALVSVAGAGPLSLAAPYLFFLAVLVFSRERGLVSALLKRAPFVLVGTLSYSIYMIHVFLYYRLMNGLSLLDRMTGRGVIVNEDGHNLIGGGALFGDAMTLLFLGGVIFLAYLSYRFIELPGQNFAKRMVGKFRSPAPATP